MPPHPDASAFQASASGPALQLVQSHAEKQDLIMHSGWFCPFVQRVWIALEERKIPYEYREVNPYHKEPSFLAINPKGLVPALEHHGKALYESHILLEYLEDAFPAHPAMRPADPYQVAKVRLALAHISTAVVPAFFGTLQAQSLEDQDKGREKLYAALRTLETSFFSSDGPYAQGAEFGLVDASIAPFLVRLYILEEHREFKAADAGGSFEQYVKDVLDRKSVRETTSERDAYRNQLGRYLRNEAQSEAAKAVRAGEAIP